LQARSKKARRSMRTLHLRIFTNRDEEEDSGQTDDRQTACGLHDTPHHLAEHPDGAERLTPDCHINVFSVDSDAMRRISLLKKYELCQTCKKRVELMASLGGLG